MSPVLFYHEIVEGGRLLNAHDQRFWQDSFVGVVGGFEVRSFVNLMAHQLYCFVVFFTLRGEKFDNILGQIGYFIHFV
jgi:hypothetical protein